MGGDFNIIFNPTLEKKGGNMELKKSTEIMEEILYKNSLQDVWRLKNPTTKRYTWRQKSPSIQCRLDYFFISEFLHDYVVNTNIIQSVRSDHSGITIHIQSLGDKSDIKGRGYWKLNSSIINDEDYVNELITEKDIWVEETSTVVDPRIRWEYLKYKIRDFSIKKSVAKRKQMKNQEEELNKKLNEVQEKLEQTDNEDTARDYNEQLEQIKNDLKQLEDTLTEGLIIRTKTRWFEEGEKSNKYFLGLEKHKGIKKCMHKLKKNDETFTTDKKEILNMQKDYYFNLYSSKLQETNEAIDQYIASSNVQAISQEQQNALDEPISLEECYETLKSQKNNKSPGNDGITSEFYKKSFGLFLVNIFSIVLNSHSFMVN